MLRGNSLESGSTFGYAIYDDLRRMSIKRIAITRKHCGGGHCAIANS
jgi:hypothetical protein